MEPNKEKNPLLIGLLLDVSGSMRSSYEGNYECLDIDMKRSQSIFDILLTLIESDSNQYRKFFAIAFGLMEELCFDNGTADLISLCKNHKKLLSLQNFVKSEDEKESLELLIELLEKSGAPFVRKFVIKHVEARYAKALFAHFSQPCNKNDLMEIIADLPDACKKDSYSQKYDTYTYKCFSYISDFLQGGCHIKEENRYLSEQGRAKIIIKKAKNFIFNFDEIFAYSLEEIINIFKTYSKSEKVNKNKENLQKFLNLIEPFIYGRTPMCSSLEQAFKIFKINNDASSKILFILSDGDATDGDPIKVASQIKKNFDVKIICCYISTKKIFNSRKIYDKKMENWEQEQINMFEMSSEIDNANSGIYFLRMQGWEIPASGKSRLFAQVNDPEIINEFCRITKLISEGDALVDLIGKISLDIYINQSLNGFTPKEQKGGTCYANATAAVLHLAMHRIVGKKIPSFEEVRNDIIDCYGTNGNDTKKCLAEQCPKYRLKYCEVNELEARCAINKKRPVLAKFKLSTEEWNLFRDFFKKNPKGVLTSEDLKNNCIKDDGGGHAVVLIRINPDYLCFMNSWGVNWADGGFFKVKDHKVLSLQFFDVFWTEDQLLSEEKEAYKIYCQKESQKIVDQMPLNAKTLPYKCPNCQKESCIDQFDGNFLDAICPKCKKNFSPTLKELMLNLYFRDH